MTSRSVVDSGRRSRRLRQQWEALIAAGVVTCARCGLSIKAGEPWDLGHAVPRALGGTDAHGLWPEHRGCNRSHGGALGHELGRRFSEPPASGGEGQSPSVCATASRDHPVFDPISLEDVPWLTDLLDVPGDAAWPRHLSPPHPDAVGSYGEKAERWIADELRIELRWWQRLALRRQLEHDAAGVLVWRTVLESTPRRAGKSVRLRAVALWRMAHAELFGEDQLVVHTGKDRAAVTEVHGKAHAAAAERGWTVRRQRGEEEIECPRGRWIVRGRASVYGYDACLALVDEAWGVEPAVVDEGLEPAILERLSPQLVLTSTAHRRATALMRRRLETALSSIEAPASTLVMVWCAPRDADIREEATWRAASPHWSEHRRDMIADKLARAEAGEAEPDADDPDPLEGFTCQYLNVWPTGSAANAQAGNPVITPERWAGLEVPRPLGTPAAVAVESWFTEGLSVAYAWPDPDGTERMVISVVDVDTAADAAALVTASGAPRALAGKSLLTSPAFAGVDVEPARSTTRASLLALGRELEDGTLLHDGGEHLSDQVLGVRTSPGADGPRLTSRGRADAIKASTWALEAAREYEAPAIF